MASNPSRSSILGTAFHWSTLDRQVISFPAKATDTITASLCTPSTDPIPQSPPSPLSALPQELLCSICLHLDFSTLFHFREVSRRIRNTVLSLQGYKTLVRTSPDCLRAVLRTDFASRLSLHTLYRKLRSSACELCAAEFAHLLHLPTLRRFCWSCLREGDARLQMVDVGSAGKVLGREIRPPGEAEREEEEEEEAEGSGRMRGLPGEYGPSEVRFEERVEIMPLSVVQAVYAREKGRELDVDSLYTAPVECFTYMACCVLPAFDPESGRADIGVSCEGCHKAAGWRRNIAYARGQRGTWDLVYSEEGFLKHFETCSEARALWKALNRDSGERMGV